jgi:Family of unknown function (DUF5694)
MKNILFILLFYSNFLFAQQPNKVKIAIIGTFHFGETSDYIAGNYPELLTLKKQNEIDELVGKLSKFYPNKIFVENTAEFQTFWDKVYSDWQKGVLPKDHQIEYNEVFQIGVKLAKKLNDPFGVICVNYLHPELNGGLRLAKDKKDTLYALYSQSLQVRKPDLKNFFDQNYFAKEILENFIRQNQEWKSLSIRKHLINLNTPESLNTLHYLNVTVWLDQNPNGIGAQLTAKEYFRNTQILQNILKKINPFDKKVVLLIGAAHVKSLKDMIEVHPLLELVDAKEILK